MAYDNYMTGFNRWDWDLPAPRYSPEWLARRRQYPEPAPLDSTPGRVFSISGRQLTPGYAGAWADRSSKQQQEQESNAYWDDQARRERELARLQAEIATEQPAIDRANEPYNLRLMGKRSPLDEEINNRIAGNFFKMYGPDEGRRRWMSTIPSNQSISSGFSDPDSPVYNADAATLRSQMFRQPQPSMAPELQKPLGQPEYGGQPRYTMPPTTGMDFSGIGPTDIPDMRTLTHPNHLIPDLPQTEPPIDEFVRWLQRMFPLVRHYEQKTPEGWRSSLVPQNPRNR